MSAELETSLEAHFGIKPNKWYWRRVRFDPNISYGLYIAADIIPTDQQVTLDKDRLVSVHLIDTRDGGFSVVRNYNIQVPKEELVPKAEVNAWLNRNYPYHIVRGGSRSGMIAKAVRRLTLDDDKTYLSKWRNEIKEYLSPVLKNVESRVEFEIAFAEEVGNLFKTTAIKIVQEIREQEVIEHAKKDREMMDAIFAQPSADE